MHEETSISKRIFCKKSQDICNLRLYILIHYTRVDMLNRITSGGAHLRFLSPGLHSSEEMLQQWQAVADTVSDMTDPVIEPQTSRTDSDAFTTERTG